LDIVCGGDDLGGLLVIQRHLPLVQGVEILAGVPVLLQ